jgi:hypothetical protein
MPVFQTGFFLPVFRRRYVLLPSFCHKKKRTGVRFSGCSNRMAI